MSGILAASLAASNTTINSIPYTPFPVFLTMLGLGIGFLVLSLLVSGDQGNDAFAALAIIPLFASSWMALQIDIPVTTGFLFSNESTLSLTTHSIYPATIPAIVLFIIGVISLLNFYRILTNPEEAPNPFTRDDGYDNGDDE